MYLLPEASLGLESGQISIAPAASQQVLGSLAGLAIERLSVNLSKTDLDNGLNNVSEPFKDSLRLSLRPGRYRLGVANSSSRYR